MQFYFDFDLFACLYCFSAGLYKTLKIIKYTLQDDLILTQVILNSLLSIGQDHFHKHLSDLSLVY